MKTIQVHLPYMNQEIVVNYGGGISILGRFIDNQRYDKILFLFDNKVFEKYGDEFKKTFANKECYYIQLLPDKVSKDIDYLGLILGKITNIGLSRKSLVVCVGGGYVSDIGGVLAGLYMRGIDYIQFSTTLMAQADCVIGKVGLNVGNKKNLVGLFNSPVLTICDVKFLETLKKQELIFALSEIYKHDLIAQDASCGLTDFSLAKYQVYLQDNIESNKDAWIELIVRSICIKKTYVEKDIYDANGLHKGLSLGHTFANVIETLIPNIKHGEAVWIGIYMSFLASQIYFGEHYIEPLTQIQNFIPFTYSKYTLQLSDILALLKKDKLASYENIRFVLIERIGSFKIIDGWSEENIHNIFSHVFSLK